MSEVAHKRTCGLFDVTSDDGEVTQWLRITIDGKETLYWIEDLRPDKRVANPAIGLHKFEAGIRYDVHLDEHGAHCSCGDFNFRHQHDGQGCKHIAALRAVGLVPRESP